MPSLTKTFPNASQSFRELNPLSHPSNHGKTRIRACGGCARGMNKTEHEYYLILEAQKQRGEIAWWGFEAIRLKLADRTTYTPDFVILDTMENIVSITKLRFIEIKGFRRDDAMVKFKIAREQFWWADFEMWQKKNGLWKQIL